MLELHSAAIQWAFWLHSNSSRDTFLQALLGQQSNCSQTAFDFHSEHFDSILNIPTKFQLVPTTFELHSRANTLIMCKNRSMWVRGEFWVFKRHSHKKWRSRPNVTRILKMFHSGWFRLIPFPCDVGFRLTAKAPVTRKQNEQESAGISRNETFSKFESHSGGIVIFCKNAIQIFRTRLEPTSNDSCTLRVC